MQGTGSGGVGFVSIDISVLLIGLVVVLIVLFVVWKVAKLLFAAFGG